MALVEGGERSSGVHRSFMVFFHGVLSFSKNKNDSQAVQGRPWLLDDDYPKVTCQNISEKDNY